MVVLQPLTDQGARNGQREDIVDEADPAPLDRSLVGKYERIRKQRLDGKSARIVKSPVD